MVVFLSHFFDEEYALNVKFAGRLGVAFFFMINGFLLVYTDRGTTKYYFRRRIIRLVPLYWLTTLMVFVIGLVSPLLLHTAESNAESLVKSLLFISFYNGTNIFPLYPIAWTLTAKVFVYLVYFISLIAVETATLAKFTESHKMYFKGLMTSGILIVILKSIVPQNIFTDAYGAYYMMYFVEGILILFTAKPMLEFSGKLKERLNHQGLIVITAFCIGLIIVSYSTIFTENLLNILLCAVLFLTTLLFFGNVSFPKRLVKGGNIGYSFYLIHYFIVKGFLRLVHPDGETSLVMGILYFSLYFAVTVVLAPISYELIEQKFSVILKKWLNMNH